jgi:hypothetical protein
MDHWMNSVGYGIPASIRLANHHIYKGRALYTQWYGGFSTGTTLGKKLKLIWNNGKRF